MCPGTGATPGHDRSRCGPRSEEFYTIPPALGARMKSVVDGSQPGFEDVGVNLRRRQIRVSEHHLDGPEIGAAIEQMGRERMPQHVRADVAANPRLHPVLLEELPEYCRSRRASPPRSSSGQ